VIVGSTAVSGCTDLDACNYDEVATVDDDSCLYNDCAGVVVMRNSMNAVYVKGMVVVVCPPY